MSSHLAGSSILFTIDVEDWFQVENFKQSIPFSSWSSYELRVEKNTYRILDLLDSITLNAKIESDDHKHPKATFFILGWLAERIPGFIREIYSRGHEVASHGYNHIRPDECSFDDFKRDLSKSKELLEDIIGDRVYGYRAPSFAINSDMLKIIEDCGYLYDSSYNSFDMHGRYGHLVLSTYIKNGISAKISDNFYELPISNIRLGNRIVPWGGGGYFRLIPSLLFHIGVKSILKKKRAYLLYMHPWEIDPEQPRVIEAPAFYKFRHYVNLKKTSAKLIKFFRSFAQNSFLTCHQYLNSIAISRS